MQRHDITAIERTGYAHEQKVAHQCSECGEPIYEGEDCYALKWGYVCEACMMNAWEVAE